LFAPPIGWGLITSAGDAWERIGRFAWPSFGGVLMIEAVKRLYIEPGGRPQKVKRAVAAPVRAAGAQTSREPVDRVRHLGV